VLATPATGPSYMGVRSLKPTDSQPLIPAMSAMAILTHLGSGVHFSFAIYMEHIGSANYKSSSKTASHGPQGMISIWPAAIVKEIKKGPENAFKSIVSYRWSTSSSGKLKAPTR
jgi:hypothetical protein